MPGEPREVWGDLATTAFVEASHLFKSLDPEARRDLLQLARVVSYAVGDVISDADEGFHLLRDGTADVVVEAEGGPTRLAHLDRGAFYGEGRVLGASRRPETLVAATDADVVVFPAAVIAAVADRFPKVRKLLEAVHAAREKDAAGKLAV
jgi:signal-transduction protein with cAMP-binding, CBS, and nucleotidyltransferase domain